MASFKPEATQRGSIKTEGFYFTSMRFPVEFAKSVSRRAQAHEMSFSDYVRQATEFAMESDKVKPASKADPAIKVSVGTTKDYSKKKGKAVKPAAAKKKAKVVEEDEEEEQPKKKSKKVVVKSSKTGKKSAPPPPDDDGDDVVVDDE